jgi:hypothetical protein
VPRVGSSRRLRRRRSEVLPEPDGPNTTNTSSARTSIVTSSTSVWPSTTRVRSRVARGGAFGISQGVDSSKSRSAPRCRVPATKQDAGARGRSRSAPTGLCPLRRRTVLLSSVERPRARPGDQQDERAEEHRPVRPHRVGHAPEAVLAQLPYLERPEPLAQPDRNLRRDDRHRHDCGCARRGESRVEAQQDQCAAGDLHDAHDVREEPGHGPAHLRKPTRAAQCRVQKLLEALRQEDRSDHETNQQKGPVGARGGR